MIVKICGLSTSETLAAALDAGADMVGFVHYARSPRHVPLGRLRRRLCAQVAGRSPKTLFTVDADDATSLSAAIEAFRARISCNCMARKPRQRVAAIREKFGRPVMKAIGLATATDLEQDQRLRGRSPICCSMRAPADAAALPGGNGRAFDWTLLAGRSCWQAMAARRRLDGGECRGGDRRGQVRRASTYRRASKAPAASRILAKSSVSSQRRGQRKSLVR